MTRTQGEERLRSARRRWLYPLYLLAIILGIGIEVGRVGLEVGGLLVSVLVLLCVDLAVSARIYEIRRQRFEAVFAWSMAALAALCTLLVGFVWWTRV